MNNPTTWQGNNLKKVKKIYYYLVKNIDRVNYCECTPCRHSREGILRYHPMIAPCVVKPSSTGHLDFRKC